LLPAGIFLFYQHKYGPLILIVKEKKLFSRILKSEENHHGSPVYGRKLH